MALMWQSAQAPAVTQSIPSRGGTCVIMIAFNQYLGQSPFLGVKELPEFKHPWCVTVPVM